MADPGDFLDKKSEASKKAADFLLTNRHYNSSVHCYYYSCFQKIKSKLLILSEESELEQDQRRQKVSSHVFYLNKIDKELTGIGANERDLFFFIKDLNTLKRLRNQADYDDIEVKPTEANSASDLSGEILKYIKDKLG